MTPKPTFLARLVMTLAACASLLAGIAGTSHAQTKAPFELVLMDSATEKRLGSFPVDRKIIAQAISALKDAGVTGVVLQFFYDQPAKDADSDTALADAIAQTKTLLQARMDDAEFGENPLPTRFHTTNIKGAYKTDLTGSSGWIPLPAFAKGAHDIGFVDIKEPDEVPMVVKYQDHDVNSLALAVLELATGETAEVISGSRVKLGTKSLSVSADNQVSIRLDSDKVDYTSFADVVDGKADMARFRGKVVVIGHEGAKAETVKTSVGPIKAHRLFYLGLLDLWRQLK
jgi:CHASE2 domain-containing sensor protein